MTSKLDSRRVISYFNSQNYEKARDLVREALSFNDMETKTDLDYLLHSCFIDRWMGTFGTKREVKIDFGGLRILCECGVDLNSFTTKTLLQRLVKFYTWDVITGIDKVDDEKSIGYYVKKAIQMILYFGANPLCNMIGSVDKNYNDEIIGCHRFLFGIRVLDKKYTINDLLPAYQLHCFHSKIKLILLSFRQGLCGFGLLASDTIKEILLFLGLSSQISSSLIDLIKQMEAEKDKPIVSRKRKVDQ